MSYRRKPKAMISAAARRAGMDRSNFKRVLRKYRTDVEPDESGDDLVQSDLQDAHRGAASNRP